MITHVFHETKWKIIQFSNKVKIMNINKVNTIHLTVHLIIYHQMKMIIINQIFLHHIHRNTVQNHIDQVKHPKIQIFIHKTQLIHKITNHCKRKNPTYTQSYQPMQRQNTLNTDYYQPTQMQNEISLPYYLQQHEITKSQRTNFSQMPNAVESLQMTMNPYLMGGSSIQSNKAMMVFTGTDPEYCVEDY